MEEGDQIVVDSAQLVRVFKKIRQARKELAAKFKKEDDALKAKMAMVEMGLMGHLNDTNSTSAKTDEGTFYKQIEYKAYAADWNVVYDWIMEDKERFEFVEKRLKVTEVVNYRDTHKTVDAEGRQVVNIPPGMTLNSEWVIRVRKANTDGGDEGD